MTDSVHVKCPKCKREIESLFCLEGDYAPKPGDIGVCSYCACAFILEDDKGAVRKVEKSDLDDVHGKELVSILVAQLFALGGDIADKPSDANTDGKEDGR